MDKKYLKEEEKLAEKSLQHNFSFSKIFKIRKSFEYQNLNRLKKRLIGNHIIIDYRFNRFLENARLGITISSKLAKAHLRNRLKRLLRETFRLNKNKLSKHLEINILVKPLKKNLTYFEIEKDFLNLLSSIKK